MRFGASSRWSIEWSRGTSARAWRPPSWTRGCSPGYFTSTSPPSGSTSRPSRRITSSAASSPRSGSSPSSSTSSPRRSRCGSGTGCSSPAAARRSSPRASPYWRRGSTTSSDATRWASASSCCRASGTDSRIPTPRCFSPAWTRTSLTNSRRSVYSSRPRGSGAGTGGRPTRGFRRACSRYLP